MKIIYIKYQSFRALRFARVGSFGSLNGCLLSPFFWGYFSFLVICFCFGGHQSILARKQRLTKRQPEVRYVSDSSSVFGDCCITHRWNWLGSTLEPQMTDAIFLPANRLLSSKIAATPSAAEGSTTRPACV